MKPFASSGSLKCSTSVSQASNRSPSSRFWYAVVSKSFAAAEKTGSSVINDSLSFKASSYAGRTKWRSWNTFSRDFSTQTITIGIKVDKQHEFRIQCWNNDLSRKKLIPFSSNLLRSFLIFVTVSRYCFWKQEVGGQKNQRCWLYQI